MRPSVAVILIALLLGACKSGPTRDVTKAWGPDRLYNEAKSELDGGNYKKSIGLYEKLEARFPYGRFAQQSQLEVAYAYYKQREPASAIAACERYIKLYPNSPNVDYAYYLKGLVSFNEDLGILAKLSNQDMTDRDPQAMRESFDALRDLVTRIPDSRYSPDAVKRMQYLVNALASSEVKVAEYYYRRRAYVAAVNRAQFALQNFPQAPSLERAFAVLVKSYAAMGLTDLQKDSERLLKLNFPTTTLLDPRAGKAWWEIF